MPYPNYPWTPQPDGSFHVVSQRPAIGLVGAVFLGSSSWAETEKLESAPATARRRRWSYNDQKGLADPPARRERQGCDEEADLELAPGDPRHPVRAICALQALFAGHFMTTFGFLVLLGLALPNYAKLRKLERQAKGG